MLKSRSTIAFTTVLLLVVANREVHSLQRFNRWNMNLNIFGGAKSTSTAPSTPIMVKGSSLPSWEDLSSRARSTETGKRMESELALREQGAGIPHTDAKTRLFGTTGEPRVLYYRDTAAWYVLVWILRSYHLT